MKKINVVSGFALLNVLLGVTLLTGIIFLIMHAMTNYHSEEKSRAMGEELVPIANALLMQDYSSITATTSYSALCTNLLKNISSGYMQSLKTSGFDICGTATVKICMGVCNA